MVIEMAQLGRNRRGKQFAGIKLAGKIPSSDKSYGKNRRGYIDHQNKTTHHRFVYLTSHLVQKVFFCDSTIDLNACNTPLSRLTVISLFYVRKYYTNQIRGDLSFKSNNTQICVASALEIKKCKFFFHLGSYVRVILFAGSR